MQGRARPARANKARLIGAGRPHRGRAGRFMGGLSPVLCSLMVADVSPWRLSQWIAGSSRARDLALWFSVPRTPLMTTCSPYSKVASPLGDPMSSMAAARCGTDCGACSRKCWGPGFSGVSSCPGERRRSASSSATKPRVNAMIVVRHCSA